MNITYKDKYNCWHAFDVPAGVRLDLIQDDIRLNVMNTSDSPNSRARHYMLPVGLYEKGKLTVDCEFTDLVDIKEFYIDGSKTHPFAKEVNRLIRESLEGEEK